MQDRITLENVVIMCDFRIGGFYFDDGRRRVVNLVNVPGLVSWF